MNVEIPLGLIDALSTAVTQERIIEAAVKWLPRIVGAERGSIVILEDGELMVRGNLGSPSFRPIRANEMRGSRVGEVLESRQPLVVSDQRLETSDAGRALTAAGFLSSMIVPLLSGDQCFGTINLSHSNLDFFGQQEVLKCTAVARLVASQIRIHQQMEMLNRMAYTDPLTGAMNRRAFLERTEMLMARFRGEGRPFAVVLLDLDRFKSINDRFGHSGGDGMLCGVVNVLRDNIRKKDMLARLGGEEFAVVLDGATLMEAEMFAERFRGLVADVRQDHDGRLISCTTSLGVAVASGHDMDTDRLLKRADAALYAAKENGRNRVELAA